MTKYLTKRDIIRLNNKAIRTKKNRSIRPDNYKVLRDTFKYPIIFSLVHNDIEMRVNILFGGVVGKLTNKILQKIGKIDKLGSVKAFIV